MRSSSFCSISTQYKDAMYQRSLRQFSLLSGPRISSLYVKPLPPEVITLSVQPLITTELLTAAILRLDPSASTFTTTHLHLAKVAYAEGYTEQALPVLSRDITSFPMTGPVKAGVLLCDPETPASVYLSQPAWSADMRPDNVLEYNFLKGQIYTSRRDWEKAELAFQGAITHPVKEKGVSKISVDAYKRWLLVSLLQNGQESTLPSYTSPTVKSSCTSLAQPYVSIAKLFPTGAAAQLKAEAEASTTLWTEDGTMSLVTEVLAAYQKWRIISLRNVYSQISVHQLAKDTASADTGESLTDLAQVHALIQSMIDQGMLQGQLEADETGTAYLTFHDNQTLLTEEDFAREIARSHHTIQALAAEFKTVNERLSSNKEYVKHMAREEKRLAKEAENPSGGFETQIEEEDLMTGIVTNG